MQFILSFAPQKLLLKDPVVNPPPADSANWATGEQIGRIYNYLFLLILSGPMHNPAESKIMLIELKIW